MTGKTPGVGTAGGIDIRARGSRKTAIGILVCGGLFASLWAVSDTPEVALVCLPLLAIALRIASARAWVEGDRLRVRNFWRIYDLSRQDIARFVVNDINWGRAQRARVVEAAVRDRKKRVRLSATLFSYFRIPPWPAPGDYKRNRADDICAELNAWLHRGA